MKKEPAASVDDYIAGFPAGVQVVLDQVRHTIRQAAPDAEETISYGMPAYKWHGTLVYFAAFSRHIGFYALPTGNEAFRKEIATYKTGKGSIQFPLDQPVPLGLITRIVKFRMEENRLKKSVRK